MKNVASIGVRSAEFVSVTALFGDTVLDSRSLAPPGARAEYLIGEDPRATATARGLPVPLFPLVRMTGADCEVAWCAGMSGHVTLQGGEHITLDELVQRGETQAREVGRVWRLPRGGRCRVDVGDTTFVVESSGRPERVASPSRMADRDVLLYDGVSLAAHAMVLFLLFSVPPTIVSASVPPIGTSITMAAFAPRPESVDALPDWIRRPRAEPRPDTTGGRPRVRATPHAAPRPSSDASAGEVARRAAMDAGVLGILSGGSGTLSRLFSKDSAIGEDASRAMNQLTGGALGAGLDVSGLIVARTGGGGGVPYGAYQTRRVPRGGVRAPSRSLDGRAPTAPEAIPGKAVVRGALDREIIRRIVRHNANQIRYCYEAALRRNPDVSGRVTVQFLVGGQGQVLTSMVQASDLGDAEAERCIADAVRRWAFPAPQGGGTVLVNYPFLLRATGE